MVFKSRFAAYLLVLMACGLLVVSTGCGKKGPPRPPVDNTAPENASRAQSPLLAAGQASE